VCLHHQLDDECNAMIDVCKTRKPWAIRNDEDWLEELSTLQLLPANGPCLETIWKLRARPPEPNLEMLSKSLTLYSNVKEFFLPENCMQITLPSAPKMKPLLRAQPTCDTLDARYPPLLYWPQKIAVGIQSVAPRQTKCVSIKSRVKPCWGTNEVTV